MAYATLTDVQALWPLASAPAITRATALLENANALLTSKRRTLAADIAAGTVDPVLARMIVVDAVVRVLANPAGVSQQALGPESVGFTGVRSLGTVAFTDAELESLTPSDAPPSVGGMAIGTARIRPPAGMRAALNPVLLGERGVLGALEDMAPAGAAALIAEVDAELAGLGPLIDPGLLNLSLDRDGNA